MATSEHPSAAMSLTLTVHATERARQRGIAIAIVELAYLEGRRLPDCGDRFLLTQERVRELRRAARYPHRMLAIAEKAAPLVVVVNAATTVVTVFRPSGGIDRAWRRGRNRRAS